MSGTRHSRSILAILLILLPACSGSGTEPQEDGGTAEKPDSLPAFASIDLYSNASTFNQPLPQDPPIDPDSEGYVSLFAGAGALVVQVGQYSAPVYIADASTPRVDVSLPCGDLWEMGVNTLIDVPIPVYAEPASDTDGSTAPSGCGEEADQDNHMVILDLVNRCEIGLWQARREGGAWVASWGNSISLDSDGVFPGGLSTRGSGFPFLGGVIWPDEMIDGEITHKLAFSYPFTRSGGPVAPATDSDGITDDPDALPIGAILQLDPDLDLTTLGLTDHEMTIATAMQVYGIILVDTGGADGIGLYAIDPVSVQGDLYEGSLPSGDFVPLPNIPLDSFRVLALPPQDGDWQNDLDLPDEACSGFRVTSR